MAITDRDTNYKERTKNNNNNNAPSPTIRRSKRIAAKQTTQQTPNLNDKTIKRSQNKTSTATTSRKTPPKISKQNQNTKASKFKNESRVISIYKTQPEWDPQARTTGDTHIMIGTKNYVDSNGYSSIINQSKEHKTEIERLKQQNDKLNKQLEKEKKKQRVNQVKLKS